MPPKKPAANKKFAEPETFQAIVMSDSYKNRFMPLTLDTPRCLLPLVSTPLIEYTLEFLATAGVQQVYVIGSSHVDKIEEYLDNSKWTSASSPFEIQVIKSRESQSIGDAMRDLDRLGIINSDFLLISGDIVSNIDFKSILQAHRERKAKDKNAIMTMVLREASVLHRTRARSGAGLFITDVETNKCLRYESAPRINSKKLHSFEIDSELLAEYDSISLRNDLIDCHIDICAPDVPALFTENFDYHDIREDFVKGILTSELLGKTIYTHILNEQYSARVESYQTYGAVSHDIISRYTYPITPEYNIMDDQTFKYHHGHIYKESDVVLAQSCIIKPESVIGKGTFIGEKTTVDKSVIGRNCKVGKNVIIENSYIWDNVEIEDNVVITQSIIASDAVIKAGAKISSGSVISFGVVVGTNKQISDAKLSLHKRVKSEWSDDEDDSDDSDVSDEAKINSDLVGSDGEGYRYHDSDDSEYEDYSEDDEEYNKSLNSLIYTMSNANISDTSIASHSHPVKKIGSRRYSSMSAVTANSDDGEETFKSEAIESIERSISENHDLDIAALELNTLRMTMNTSYHEVREATMAAFVKYVYKLISTGTLNAQQAAEKIFGGWSGLLKRQVFDSEDEVDLLFLIQKEFAAHEKENGGITMTFAVRNLYFQDILQEENIYAWFDSPKSQATSELKAVRNVVQQLVQWLRTADEESDGDKEEDSDSE